MIDTVPKHRHKDVAWISPSAMHMCQVDGFSAEIIADDFKPLKLYEKVSHALLMQLFQRSGCTLLMQLFQRLGCTFLMQLFQLSAYTLHVHLLHYFSTHFAEAICLSASVVFVPLLLQSLA